MARDGLKVCQAMATALSKTLEEMAFAEVIPLDDLKEDEFAPAPLEDTDDVFWATIPLIRPNTGFITLIVKPELALNLTEMIYGFMEEGALTDEVVLDSIAEMANVIAGRFFNEILSEEKAFELGLPAKGRCEELKEVPEQEGECVAIDYAVEGAALKLILNSDELKD